MCDYVKRLSVYHVYSCMLAVNILLKAQMNCPSRAVMTVVSNSMDISNGVNAIIHINKIRIIIMQFTFIISQNKLDYFFLLDLT